MSEKVINIAQNEQKMFDFMKIVLEVNKAQCNYDPRFCGFTNFLLSLKMCLEQNISVDEKRKFFMDYCPKHKYVLKPLEDYM